MLRLHNEDLLLLKENPEMAVRRVRGWCEIAPASVIRDEKGSAGKKTVESCSRVWEPRGRGMATVGRHHQTAH
jgi:hypothetical protein